MRNIGIICIFHYEVKNITSIQDVRETVVYNELVTFTLYFENRAASVFKSASINLGLLYTYLNTYKIEEALNANSSKASSIILYLFTITTGVISILWIL